MYIFWLISSFCTFCTIYSTHSTCVYMRRACQMKVHHEQKAWRLTWFVVTFTLVKIKISNFIWLVYARSLYGLYMKNQCLSQYFAMQNRSSDFALSQCTNHWLFWKCFIYRICILCLVWTSIVIKCHIVVQGLTN